MKGDERNRTAGRGLGTSYTQSDFGHYLAGLTDGEGCFVIAPNALNAFKCQFLIHLRADDKPLLEWLREQSGLGNLYRGRREKIGGDQPSWRWDVSRRRECLQLVALFEQFPLRSKKARDFALWAQAVRAWTRQDFGLMRELWIALKATRAFENKGVAFAVDDPQMEMEVA